MLDLDRSTTRASAETPPEPVERIVYTQDVKCLHCGFILGQLVGRPSLPPGARSFRPTPGHDAPANFQPAQPRCFRCGGPCFLDAV